LPRPELNSSNHSRLAYSKLLCEKILCVVRARYGVSVLPIAMLSGGAFSDRDPQQLHSASAARNDPALLHSTLGAHRWVQATQEIASVVIGEGREIATTLSSRTFSALFPVPSENHSCPRRIVTGLSRQKKWAVRRQPVSTETAELWLTRRRWFRCCCSPIRCQPAETCLRSA